MNMDKQDAQDGLMPCLSQIVIQESGSQFINDFRRTADDFKSCESCLSMFFFPVVSRLLK
jgi:hypothetical protein